MPYGYCVGRQSKCQEKELMCPAGCNFSTHKEKKLVKHLKKVHGKSALRCPFCMDCHCQWSLEPSQLSSHKRKQHRETQLRCFLCEFTFRSLAKWVKHGTLHHNKHMCGLFSLASQREFSSTQSTNSHSTCLSHRAPSLFYAPMQKGCSQTESVDIKTEKDTANAKSVHFNCVDDHRVQTDGHVKSSHRSNCEIAQVKDSQSETFRQGTDLKDNEDLRFQCDAADKFYHFEQPLKRHKASLHGPAKFECGECYKQFVEKHELLTHLSSHEDKQSIKCPFCDSKLFGGQSHEIIEHYCVKRRFPCKYCSKVFAHRSGVSRHIKTKHSINPRHICILCNRNYHSAGCLKEHMRIHTGEKPYACHACSYRTGQLGNLLKHKKIHTGEKPYKCSICGHATNRKGSLQDHIRTHTGEKPFSCKHCLTSFARRDTLTRHLRSGICVR